jgi:hypothetical protein
VQDGGDAHGDCFIAATAAGCRLARLAVTAHAQPAETETPATRVTSDSPEFCAQLADMLRQDVRTHQLEPVPDEVRMLGREGRKMCREGHIRPGILRIRRALLILRGEVADPR